MRLSGPESLDTISISLNSSDIILRKFEEYYKQLNFLTLKHLF